MKVDIFKVSYTRTEADLPGVCPRCKANLTNKDALAVTGYGSLWEAGQIEVVDGKPIVNARGAEGIEAEFPTSYQCLQCAMTLAGAPGPQAAEVETTSAVERALALMPSVRWLADQYGAAADSMFGDHGVDPWVDGDGAPLEAHTAHAVGILQGAAIASGTTVLAMMAGAGLTFTNSNDAKLRAYREGYAAGAAGDTMDKAQGDDTREHWIRGFEDGADAGNQAAAAYFTRLQRGGSQ